MAGWLLVPRPPAATAPPDPAPAAIATDSLNIPALVADGIATGDLTCPDTDPLRREACLLFQGALGVWQRKGFPDRCGAVDPAVGDPEAAAAPVPSLRPDDALRAPTAPCFGYLYAIQVASATPILVSTPLRSYRVANDEAFAEPGSDPQACLGVRYGLCGNHTALAIALLRGGGLEARPVEFYFEEGGRRHSHITPEVLIDGEWRLIDTTYGAYWMHPAPGGPFELVPTDALVGVPDPAAVRFDNRSLLPMYGIVSDAPTIAARDLFRYLDPDAGVVRGGSGVVTISIGGREGIETFAHRPNYVGDNLVDSTFRGVSYRLIDASPAEYSLRIRVSASAASEAAPIELCVDEHCLDYSRERGVYDFRARAPRSLHLRTTMDVAYVVLESLEWTATR